MRSPLSRFAFLALLPLALLGCRPPRPPIPQPLREPFGPGPEGFQPVDVEALRARITGADRLVVLSLDPAGQEWPAYESSNPQDLAQLAEALRVDPEGGGFRDMCDGQPAIRIYRGKEALGRISFHHGTALRYNRWETDLPITDPEPLLRWFDARGIDGPRKEVEENRVQAEKDRKAAERWLAAMPEALRPQWEEVREGEDSGDRVDRATLREALAKAVPSQPGQSRALFTWFGSGAGPWSGYPSYEGVAEEILLTYSTPELLEVAESPDLTEAQTEGAARLFGGWAFGQARGEELAQLSPTLKARLLARALASDDEDKKDRARYAFEGPP